MKKYNYKFKLLEIMLFAFFAITYSLLPITYAATTTPTKNPTPSVSKNAIPTDSVELEKIQKIKDIVASKVAELNLVEKRGIIGKVKENNKMHIIIEDLKGNVRNIDVDELTNFSIGKKRDSTNNLGLSDLKKNTNYSFVGTYNKDTQRLLARTIADAENIPIFFEGIISNTDSKQFQINVISATGEEKTIDIQNSTKTLLSKADGTITRSGFSKLEENQRVLVVGYFDLNDKDIIQATRALHFEQLPPSKEMQQYVKAIIPTSSQDEN